MFSIKTERYLELSHDIASYLVKLFSAAPSKEVFEKIKTFFYYPFEKGSDSSNNVKQGGCLYEKCMKTRGKLIRNGRIPKNKALPEGLFIIINIV